MKSSSDIIINNGQSGCDNGENGISFNFSPSADNKWTDALDCVPACTDGYSCRASTGKCVCIAPRFEVGEKCISCASTEKSLNIPQSNCQENCSTMRFWNSNMQTCDLNCKSDEIKLANQSCTTCSSVLGVANATDKNGCFECFDKGFKGFWNVGLSTCWSCDVPENHFSDVDNGCHKCPNRFLTYNISASYSLNVCSHCSIQDYVMTTKENCERCPNRVYIQATGRCVNNDYITGQVYSLDNQAYIKCTDDVSIVPRSDQECVSQCPNRIILDGYCVLAGYNCAQGETSNLSKECISCDDAVNVANITTRESCFKCRTDGIDVFWNVSLSTCWSCDEEEGHFSDIENGCHECPNRFFAHNTVNSLLNVCTLCSTPDDTDTSQEYCERCPNRVWVTDASKKCVNDDTKTGQIYSTVDQAYIDCFDDMAIVPRSDDECTQKCPNRAMSNGYCVLGENACPAGLAVKDANDICYSCDTTDAIAGLTQNQCNSCLSSIRLKATDGLCYLCLQETEMITSEEDCLHCGNRHWNAETGDCYIPQECPACGENYQCNEGTGLCECIPPYIEENGECIWPDYIECSPECSSNYECDTSQGVCVCPESMVESNGLCCPTACPWGEHPIELCGACFKICTSDKFVNGSTSSQGCASCSSESRFMALPTADYDLKKAICHSCPEGSKRYLNSSGNCGPCSKMSHAADSANVSSIEECEACGGEAAGFEYKTAAQTGTTISGCFNCNDTSDASISQERCQAYINVCGRYKWSGGKCTYCGDNC